MTYEPRRVLRLAELNLLTVPPGKPGKYGSISFVRDVCLFAESAESLQRVCDHVSTVIEEYGLKVSEKKSKVVCINGIRGY